MDLTSALFWVTAGITGASALAVLFTQNIVRAAVWLLICLAGVGGIFFLLGSDFVGSTQVIIYVGGIMVLVVFGVMLTAQGPLINLRVGPAEWAITALTALVLFGVIVSAIPKESTWDSWFARKAAIKDLTPDKSGSTVQLGTAFLGVREATSEGRITGVDKDIPRTRMSYFLPFEIVSVHLLVVLIGAAYLARAKRRKGVAS